MIEYIVGDRTATESGYAHLFRFFDGVISASFARALDFVARSASVEFITEL